MLCLAHFFGEPFFDVIGIKEFLLKRFAIFLSQHSHYIMNKLINNMVGTKFIEFTAEGGFSLSFWKQSTSSRFVKYPLKYPLTNVDG